MHKESIYLLVLPAGADSIVNFREEFPSLIALHANSFGDLGDTKWCTRPGALREEEMIHDANAGAQAVVPHMGAPGANGRDLNPYVLRARICSGQSGQDVVDLAGTGSPIRGRVKLRRLRLAVPGIKGNEAMRRNEPTESVRVESSIPDMERSAADGTPNKWGLRGEFSLKVPGHDEGRPLGNALDRTTELVQQALSLFLEGFLVASKVVWMLVAVEEFNSTRRHLDLHP